VTKLDDMVGKRVQVTSSAGGFVNSYIGKVGIITYIKPNKSLIFRVMVRFSKVADTPYSLVPLNESELRYLNNRKVTLD
jgi:hypothetical protein